MFNDLIQSMLMNEWLPARDVLALDSAIVEKNQRAEFEAIAEKSLEFMDTMIVYFYTQVVIDHRIRKPMEPFLTWLKTRTCVTSSDLKIVRSKYIEIGEQFITEDLMRVYFHPRNAAKWELDGHDE